MAKNVSMPIPPPKRKIVVGICAVLAAITWLVFGQTLGHEFVTYDDPEYVSGNTEVTAGLSIQGIRWAFTHTISGHWHPLTTISHMLDCQLYGLNASGHHFTNVVLHTIAVILLFLVLRQLTGTLWRSAFVAALFAIHPLHVESVAWISERKDVLSAVFFMLTLGAYARYVRMPSPQGYLLMLFVFFLGLMSKPMLVTVPFILLLLDYWPLGRIRDPGFAKGTARQAVIGSKWSMVSRLVTEKTPLFMLSVLSSVVTLIAQPDTTGMANQLPLAWRLNNAVVSYVAYIGQMFWPVRLATFYPHPNDQLPLWDVLLAIAFLTAVSLLAFHWRKERPYIVTGWFWYIGMLVPVIGLIQAGEMGRADRYSYLPQIGLYLVFTWGVTDLMTSFMTRHSPSQHGVIVSRRANHGSHRARAHRSLAELRRTNPSRGYKMFYAAIAAVIIITLSWRAFVQTTYWKNSETLWNHTLAVMSDNDTAQYNLGYLYQQRGELDSAIAHFESALKIRSRKAAGHYNAGGAQIENNLGSALAQKGLLTEAIAHYEKAVQLRPHYGDPYLNLGTVLFRQGSTGDAIAQWQKAAGTEPKDVRFHVVLGDAFLSAGLQQDAIAEYEHAARISARDPLARNNLAWLLATSPDPSIRDGDRAVELGKEAVRLSGGKDPNCLRTLAAAWAESGRFTEARETAQSALQVAERVRNSAVANALRDEIALYELDLPYRSSPR
jgi:tetratricopeptide (TPR) repeat protein